jgi:phosphate transport system substrate-binding protein
MNTGKFILSAASLISASLFFSGCGSQTPVGQAELSSTTDTTESTKPAAALDPNLAAYAPVSTPIAGLINSKGSESMSQLMKLWTQRFKELYPNVQIQIDHKGSGDAPVALVLDQATLGAMSRDWKPKEIEDFETKHGFKPTKIRTSIDMLAVYVHKDNPLAGLTLQQLDAIFSNERRGGYPRNIRTWQDLGVTDERFADKPISMYGRNASSGTYGYFKEHALYNGTFKNTVKEQAGSSAVVGAIANDLYGIGYSGIGYKTQDVRAIPLALTAENPFVPAEAENAYNGKYPLARYLYLNVKRKPGEILDPLRQEFLRFVLSREGQAQVLKAEYLPIPATIAQEELADLESPP